MSSIYYINFNQDGGATSTDEVKAAQKAAAIRIQAKSRSASDRKQFLAKKQATIRMQAISRGEKVRSCINELDYFINHKEKCKNQPINYDTKNHLVLGEPQKMINKDGREWIVYNATIQNNAKTGTDDQVNISALFNEEQIGGKYKKIKISSIKKKISQDNEDIYLVDPSIHTIPKKHNHIQAVAAAEAAAAAAAEEKSLEDSMEQNKKFAIRRAEKCSKCGISIENYKANPEYCNQCINTSQYVDLEGKKAYNLQLKNLQFQRQYKLERDQREK